jgi:hypothetical protein
MLRAAVAQVHSAFMLAEDAPKVAPASRKNHHVFAPFSMKPASMTL